LDYFEFTVLCSDGGYLGGQIFQINIQNPTNVSSYRSENPFKLYPNPNTGSFTIIVPEQWKSPYRISLINVLGQQFYTQTINQRKTQLDLYDLPSGIYSCEVRTAQDALLSQKVLILRQ
jgi:hypothetical protein